MPIFTRKRIRPRLVRVLSRALDNPSTTDEQKVAIEKALADPKALDKLTSQVGKLAGKEGAPDPPGDDDPTPPDHPFLTWLMQNLPAILAMLMKIFGM
jgi:hypothetical protein